MILADTSAWVEYLRATGSPIHLRLRELIADEGGLVTTEVAVMELHAGAADAEEVARLRRLGSVGGHDRYGLRRRPGPAWRTGRCRQEIDAGGLLDDPE